VGLGSLVLVACGDGGAGDGGAGNSRGTGGSGGVTLDCTTLTNPPPDCQKSCASDSQCEASFCSNGVCLAQCTADEGCATGSSCNISGRCVPDVGTGGTGGSGNIGGSGCQSVEVTPTRSIPNVMFLVDRSGSMVRELDGTQPEPGEPTRWRVAHDAIETVMGETESIVRFGLATYHWNDDQYSLNNSPPDPECPIVGPAGGSVQSLVPVGFALDNASAILALYPQEFPNDPQGGSNDTPTGESIDKLVAWIDDNPPPPLEPTIIVLATDGEPDSCMYPDSNQSLARQLSVDAATDACAAQDSACTGIQTYVLSVGSQVGQDHLQDMANVGLGLPEDGSQGNAQFWVGSDADGLETAFRDIIGASISCDVQMDKRFDDVNKACAEGDVRLDGTPLSCPGEWRVKPGVDNVIELVDDEMVDDDACDTFKSGDVTFSAEFPCGAIIVE
jgi:hypothetical protein